MDQKHSKGDREHCLEQTFAIVQTDNMVAKRSRSDACMMIHNCQQLPFICRDTFPDPQQMAETASNSIHYVFFSHDKINKVRIKQNSNNAL